MRPIAIALVVLGVLATIAAVLYFALPAHSLPAFLPGRVANVDGHRNRRGIAGLVAAAVFFGLAWMVARRDDTASA